MITVTVNLNGSFISIVHIHNTGMRPNFEGSKADDYFYDVEYYKPLSEQKQILRKVIVHNQKDDELTLLQKAIIAIRRIKSEPSS